MSGVIGSPRAAARNQTRPVTLATLPPPTSSSTGGRVGRVIRLTAPRARGIAP
jgi:hypothetical protein